MREQEIQKRIMLAASRERAKIFRNNVGRAWAGAAKPTKDGGVFIPDARPFHAGLIKGSSDLIGWTPVTIEGKQVAVFTAIEVKTETGRIKPEQQRFIDNVLKDGGIAGVCRSAQDATDLIRKWVATICAILFAVVASAQVDLKITVPKKTTEVRVMHGDTVVYLSPRFGKIIVRNIDEPCRIEMIPSGRTIIYTPQPQPK